MQQTVNFFSLSSAQKYLPFGNLNLYLSTVQSSTSPAQKSNNPFPVHTVQNSTMPAQKPNNSAPVQRPRPDDDIVVEFGTKVNGKSFRQILNEHQQHYNWFQWLKYKHNTVGPKNLEVSTKAREYFSKKLPYWDEIESLDAASELPTRSDRRYDNDDNVKINFGTTVRGMTFKQILENHEACEDWLRWLKYKSKETHSDHKIISRARNYFRKHLRCWNQLPKWEDDYDDYY